MPEWDYFKGGCKHTFNACTGKVGRGDFGKKYDNQIFDPPSHEKALINAHFRKKDGSLYPSK